MYPRTNYEMTQADFDDLMEAMKPVPMIMLNIGGGSSQQENANNAWRRLGEKMGFDYMSVRPIPGKGNLFFSAIPSENETQIEERVKREDEEKKRANVKRLEGEIAQAQAKLLDLLK